MAALAEAKTFDYLIIESSGVSEPQQVAETFAVEFAEMHLQAADDLKAEAERVKAEARARRLEKEGKGGDEDEEVSDPVHLISYDSTQRTGMLTPRSNSIPRRPRPASSSPRSSVKEDCPRSLVWTPALPSSMLARCLTASTLPTSSPSESWSFFTSAFPPADRSPSQSPRARNRRRSRRA